MMLFKKNIFKRNKKYCLLGKPQKGISVYANKEGMKIFNNHINKKNVN